MSHAASSAMALARNRGLREIKPDELLLGCLLLISQFGIARIGELSVDLEELGVDWLSPNDATAAEVVYSKEAQAVLDQAARIARASNSAAVRIEDVLVSFSALPCRVMAELKERQRFTAVQPVPTWFAAFQHADSVESVGISTDNSNLKEYTEVEQRERNPSRRGSPRF